MAVRRQTWGPDTCDCRIEETYDDATNLIARTYTWLRTLRTGPEHAALVGAPLHVVCHDENTRKNDALSIILSLQSGLELENIAWNYNATRTLQISFLIPVSGLAKMTMRNSLDLQFGPGKVDVS